MSDVSADVPLRDGERAIRSDVVCFSMSSTAGMFPNPPVIQRHQVQQLARMVITSERIIWLPPVGITWWYRFAPALVLLTLSAVRRFAPLTTPDEIELADVTRLWKWHPEFSGPPMIQVSLESWLFQLVEDRRPWNAPASKAAMREQFEALGAAWEAARSRAASHDPQP